jgi:flagellar basal body-associated protein FliL
MTQDRDSDQQRPRRWGSNKFIIVLALAVIVALVGNVVARMGVNPADTAATQSNAQSPPAPAPAEPDGKSEQTVQTPAGTSKDQPADSPQP